MITEYLYTGFWEAHCTSDNVAFVLAEKLNRYEIPFETFDDGLCFTIKVNRYKAILWDFLCTCYVNMSEDIELYFDLTRHFSLITVEI